MSDSEAHRQTANAIQSHTMSLKYLDHFLLIVDEKDEYNPLRAAI